MEAAERWSPSWALRILNWGADPNVRNCRAATALHYAAGPRALKYWQPHHSEEFWPPIRPSDWDDTTEDSVWPGGQETDDMITAELLVARGAEINAQDNDGMTPLHLASGWGRPGTVRKLLQLGADAEIADHLRRKPLDLARLHPGRKQRDGILLILQVLTDR